MQGRHKTVLLVPGYQEDITSRDYVSLIRAIEAKGYAVQFVPINWTRTTIDDWTYELNIVYKKYDPAYTILAGFSYGAMTAFMAAIVRIPAELWLFSLSPYFAEDIGSPLMSQSWLRGIGKRRTAAFQKLNFQQLAMSITCKTRIFVGELEMKKYPIIGTRAAGAHMHIKGSEITTIPNARHDAVQPEYIAAVRYVIG